MTFPADSSVDAVVSGMYRVFELGKMSASSQLEKSRAPSERNPNRNVEWRKIRETDPPAEAFISTSAPAGDPNSLLRAGNKLPRRKRRRHQRLRRHLLPKQHHLRRLPRRLVLHHLQLHLHHGCRIRDSSVANVKIGRHQHR